MLIACIITNRESNRQIIDNASRQRYLAIPEPTVAFRYV